MISKRIKIVGILGAVILLLGFWLRINTIEKKVQDEVNGLIKIEKEIFKEYEEVMTEEKSVQPEKKIPEKLLIQVPFAVQAPFAIWDEYHEEACEEASLIMVAYFLKNKKLSPEISEQEIQALIKFQIENYGDYKDSSAEELVKLAEDFYGIENLRVIYDFSKEDFKKYLSLGNPIIIPVAGQLLGNPYFTPPGPLYHNLVLVGYNGDRIITNDPGTKRGEGYSDDADVLYKAIHDFTGKKENIEKGRKAMIIIK